MSLEQISDVESTDSASASEIEVVQIGLGTTEFNDSVRSAANVLAAGRAVIVVSGYYQRALLALHISRSAGASCTVEVVSDTETRFRPHEVPKCPEVPARPMRRKEFTRFTADDKRPWVKQNRKKRK